MNGKDMPSHIGIIMDGNGRWAKRRKVLRSKGHSKGAEVFKKIALYASKLGVKILTVYAFSTENWKRPSLEVDAIMGLFRAYLKDAIENFYDENIRVVFLGDKSILDDNLQTLMIDLEKNSAKNTGMVLCIAVNYGGRAEIARACRKISEKVLQEEIDLNDIDEDIVSKFLYTAGIEDPDLIIRTGGEHRVSNFLIWQSAYSEYVVLDKLWPDFESKDLDFCIDIYRERNRRFGGV